MSSREEILATVRANLPSTARALPQVPLYDADAPTDLLAHFSASLERIGGIMLDAGPSDDPLAVVKTKLADAKVICSATTEFEGHVSLADIAQPRDLANVDFSVVRACFGVAETGSLLLSDEALHVNAMAYLAQHLIVLLDPKDIVVNLHHAYQRPEFRTRHYASFHSGPSATADIEGVLIHGAQGVRSLSVVPVARPAKGS
ncbi:LutC/YkgG family protein [Xanthobacter sp. TB0139]|uniref:LutC/YkgG family protein n=1 Tax=Xanthobacter sp. TB0139 TaxID=3459178 RepID=UPI00403A1CB5